MFFFFNDTATTEIYTLSLHDALPILTDVPASSRSRGDAEGVTSIVTVPSPRSEEHTSELQSQSNIVCRLLLEKKIGPVRLTANTPYRPAHRFQVPFLLLEPSHFLVGI